LKEEGTGGEGEVLLKTNLDSLLLKEEVMVYTYNNYYP
jgi:hypothetical protein